MAGTETDERRRGSFEGTILLSGKTATGIEVPEGVVASLGAGKKPAVKVAIGRHTYRSTVAVMDGKFMIPISAENRTSAGVKAGDVVRVDLELDTEPREISIPADFAEALEGDARARQTFESLPRSGKQWHVLSIEGAKTDETRQRRIARSISTLREGKPR
jgi:hypothetical protein